MSEISELRQPPYVAGHHEVPMKCADPQVVGIMTFAVVVKVLHLGYVWSPCLRVMPAEGCSPHHGTPGTAVLTSCVSGLC